MELNHETYYRALTARDRRFDGIFFVAVTTTKIYCRPICPARTPRSDRCRFFSAAAVAEAQGFRPCLRCRPELAPGHSSVDVVGSVARAASARIEAGALNGGGRLDDLASDLGMSARQLRRVVRETLGVSPVQLAQTHRLLLAKQLLTETALPITRVAFASGFESVRRFNALFQAHYRLTPTRLRSARRVASEAGTSIKLRLTYRRPLAWDSLLAFLEGRSIVGVERVSGVEYARTAAVGAHRGWLRVSPSHDDDSLVVEVADALVPVLPTVLAKVRHLFDLNAQPDVIAAQLENDPRIGPMIARLPGLRVPGSFQGFDLAWRAILGQQVSVRAATTLASRFANAFGEPIETPDPALNRLAPLPERVAEASPEDLTSLGILRSRAQTIVALARAVAHERLRLEPGGDPETTIRRLESIPGIGAWTAQYIAMRALGWPDAFPHSDLGLLRGLGETSPARLLALAEAWRPWRSYAAIHVWSNPMESPKEIRT